jgi:hypothetical protein
MPLENPTPPASSGRAPRARPWRAVRAVVPFALIAAALLAASQLLWLWYSWPVRHVLDDEQVTIGAGT